ncbi:MAG: CDP-alcohol phosphatidyltransferase family protein, partial [Erysipelotrichia bacterium]|nr:CDP-alcohol phosphatidyltransferase family protein [Erysipelotrichia bacterium]
MFKYTANIITLMRIPLAVAMLWAVPFSDLFWMIYICCGMTDIVDGFVAGTFHQESMLGSKLDSIADLVFAASMMIFIAINIAIPDWMWLCILIVALLRLTGYGIGFCRFHTYASLHTYANKITGAAIFLFPLFYRFC